MAIKNLHHSSTKPFLQQTEAKVAGELGMARHQEVKLNLLMQPHNNPPAQILQHVVVFVCFGR